jgi:tRNA(Arg) A34 adenosine deaminase TadA
MKGIKMSNLYLQLDRLTNALLKYKKENGVLFQRNKYIVGALALDSNDSVIAVSFNSYIKTHPYMKELAGKANRHEAIYLHAEVSALIKARGNAHTIVIARLTANDNLALSRPCSICEMALKEAKVENVYYTNNDGELVLFNMNRNEEKVII